MKGESNPTNVNYLNFIHTPEILQYINILWIKTIYVFKYLTVICFDWITNYRIS